MAITDLIDIPSTINIDVHSAKQRTMLSLLGNPRGSYNQECQPMTHPNLSSLCVTDSVGPFRVTGLLPAVDSLKQIMEDMKQQEGGSLSRPEHCRDVIGPQFPHQHQQSFLGYGHRPETQQ